MISEFVREQKRYTQKDLCKILRCSEEIAIPLIRKLKEFGVLKAVKASDFQPDMTDLMDEDIEVADVEIGEDEYLYVFTFVGVIVVAGRVLKCYPKYLLNADRPKNELRQVLKVLEKYNTKEQIVRMFNDSSESNAFNLLAVLLFLMQDYYENGVYSNTEDIIESNGSGEILWDKTINETFTLLSNNRPYYLPLLERKGRAIFQARPVRDNVPEYFLEWLRRQDLKPKELVAKLRLSQELGFEAVMRGQTDEVQVPALEIEDVVQVAAVDLTAYDALCGAAKGVSA